MKTISGQPSDPAESTSPKPLIVAIAKSAGDLDVLTAILKAVPTASDLAIVIAQRAGAGELHPESLAPLTGFPVTPITDGAPVQPGHLYVTPAHAMVGVRKGRFRLRPPRKAGERRAPVDHVFRALARDCGSRVIGVALAGQGSDGATGLQAIGAAGGMTMAQAIEATPGARTDGIAISSFVDHVLGPDDIAPALLDYVKFWTAAETGEGPRLRRRGIQERMGEICGILHERTGVDFKYYRTTTLLRRIERRMHVLRLESVDAYVEWLASEAQEAQALFRELLIGVTSFFRDPDAFASLAQNVLTPLLQNRSSADPVRLWVAACATGEEAYSIAILVRELLDGMDQPPKAQIFATDVNERAVSAARRGNYPQEISENLSPERLARFFVKRGRRYHVTQELREMVLFSVHNVIADPPFSRLDLISCRNLLIYLGTHLQKKLIPLFHYALRRGGYLFLGSSETRTGHGELFRDIDVRHRLAQRKDIPLRAPGLLGEPARAGAAGARDLAPQPGVDLGAMAQRIILNEFAPQYAIVNEEGQIVFLSEGVERYIQPPPGAFSNNIMRMARRGLSVGLRRAFGEARRIRRTTFSEISMRTLEGPQRVRLAVQPMPELGLDEGLYMFMFQDLGPVPPPARSELQGGGRSDADGVIEHLEQELMRVREDLDRTVQDLEAANEELKSSNEELLSMNEELQSANEELETSKEDIQSANDELAASNADLENLHRSSRIATIFLDRNGAIRGFTPAASEVYHLAPGDSGRPLDHFTHVLIEPPPLPELDEVSGKTDPIEHEVRATDGRRLTRRVLPYRDQAGAVGGLVITFLDVTRQKLDEQQLREAENNRRIALDAAAMGMWWWDASGEEIIADARFRELLGLPETDTLTRDLFLSRIDPHDVGRMRKALFIAQTDKDRHHFEFRVAGRDGSVRWLTSIGQRQAAAGPSRWSGVIFDITARKHSEEEAQRATELLDSVAQVTDDLIYVKDRESRLLFANPAMFKLTGRPAGGRMPDWHVRQAEAEAILANDRRIIESGVGEVVEEAFTPAGGETRFFSSNKKPMFGPDGAVTGIVGVSSDITEYKRVLTQRDRLLAEVEAERTRLATILKTLPAGVAIGEAPSGKIVLVNDAAAAQLGEWVRDPGKFSEYRTHRLRTRDGSTMEAEDFPLAQTLRGESLIGEELVIIRPDGVRKISSVSATPLWDAQGNLTAGVVTFVDITARVEAETALAESERNYRVLFEQAAVGIEQAALDGRIAAVNDQLCAMLGYSREELLTKTFVDITDPADLPRERRRHKRLYSGKADSYVFEKRYVRRNGTRLWARVTSSLARDEAGVVLYRMSIIEDISERRRAQTALRESEARYRATFDQAAIGIAHVGLDGRWLAVNDRLCAITGYAREEMLRRRFQDITHPDDLDANVAMIGELLSGGRETLTFEKRYLRKDGAIVWVNVTAALVRDDDGAPGYLISVIEDVTEDVRGALADARLASIVRSSQDAIIGFDHAHRIDSWNSGAERLFGYRPKEALGRQRAMLIPPSRQHEPQEAIDRITAGELLVSMETERVRKDGTSFPCAVTVSPVHAANGELLGFSWTIRDITERRKAEERQRLMARELVHRVKNSFAVIQSIVRQTQRSTPDPEAFAQAFSGRLAAMAAAHDLLTDRQWEGAGLRDLITSQLAPFAAGAEKRVRIEGPDVTLNTSLAVPLGLALHELATNAAKYGSLSKPGGSVDLSWTVTRAAGAEQLSLTWREIGGPPVGPPGRRGFGTSLIERGLPDARIERRFEPDGLVCKIELPTSGVQVDTN